MEGETLAEGGEGSGRLMIERRREGERGERSVKTRVCEGDTYVSTPRDEWWRKGKEGGWKKSELIVRNGPLGGGGRESGEGKGGKMKRSARYSVERRLERG